MRASRLASIAAALAGGLLASSAGGAGAPEVSVRLFAFRPATLEVEAGATVAWRNQDDIEHTVTSGTPERRDARFDARLGGRGATATVEFAAPGVYPYFCLRHQAMRGEIRVR
jgi:plastocyanin